jgi:hypothetical protein
MSSCLDCMDRAMALGEAEEDRGRGGDRDVEDGRLVCNSRLPNSSKLKLSHCSGD